MEIILETEPEWKLYEMLRARQIDFKISADRIRLESQESPAGRAWFLLPKGDKMRYDGANGFLLVDGSSGRKSYHTLAEFLRVLEQRRE